ncbi:hypothetical protein EJ110_NYTH03561 [Nymphaea thermarum]|nr:hypothetical protein EJ110_NYTH03561 [Nymphaea thermarum]
MFEKERREKDALTQESDGESHGGEEKEARMTMMHLANLINVPMALHTAVKLDQPDQIWQGGAKLPVWPNNSWARPQPSLA